MSKKTPNGKRVMNERAIASGRTIQIVCADPDLLHKYRLELERREPYQVRVALSASEARRSSPSDEPSVILLDESAAPPSGLKKTLESVVSKLTEAAPVVVVATAGRQAELVFPTASRTVDFVDRAGSFVSLAADSVERHLRMADYTAVAVAGGGAAGDFGEILRHEVNNPLTGILGNAELLLVRRERLPPGAAERVETIAELAMRLRETVRRLSHAWEERHEAVRSS